VTEAPALDSNSPDTLSWLTGVLWGPDTAVRAVVGRPPPGLGRSAWGLLPDRRDPRLLVPLDSPRPAATALRQYSDGMTQRARLAKALLGLGLRCGGVQWLLRRRGLVLLVGAHGGDGPAAMPLLDHAAEVLGKDDLTAAIIVGSPRPNRKPVVQLLRTDGAPVGYMKVGWNHLTRRLVRNEASVLARLAEREPGNFSAPRLLHHGRWRDLEIAICASLPHRLWRHGRLYALPPVAASREVAGLGGVERAVLGDSPYWHDLHDRLTRMVRLADGRERWVLGAALDKLAGRADAQLAFGTWHGDWGPWNMRRTGARLLVWDWERSGQGVPVGFDDLHFRFQTALRGQRRSPAAATEAALRAVAPRLPALGQAAGVEELVADLYLLERLCRLHEAEVSAVTGRPDRVGAALLEVVAGRLGKRRLR
jgi:hypothetical protein